MTIRYRVANRVAQGKLLQLVHVGLPSLACGIAVDKLVDRFVLCLALELVRCQGNLTHVRVVVNTTAPDTLMEVTEHVV